MNPPSALQGAMGRERKPFTYTPGGLDLSEIKSERMAKRLMRNAMNQGVPELPPQVHSPSTPTAPIAVPNFNCLPVQVFPTINLPANPKSLLRTRSTPEKPREPPVPRVQPPPPAQNTNNYRPSGMEQLREAINSNSQASTPNNNFNRPVSAYETNRPQATFDSDNFRPITYDNNGASTLSTSENNNNRLLSGFEYNRPTSMYEFDAPPVCSPMRTTYGSDSYTSPVLPEISYDAKFCTFPSNSNNGVDTKKFINSGMEITQMNTSVSSGTDNYTFVNSGMESRDLEDNSLENTKYEIPISNIVEAKATLPENEYTQPINTDFTIKPLSETIIEPVMCASEPPEETEEAYVNDQTVRVVKKQVKKKVESDTQQNGDQNGEPEAEMIVKLPAKKSAAKTETKVEVVKKTLPDGSIEETKTTITKTTVDGKTNITTKTETTIIPKAEDEVEEVEEEEEEEEEVEGEVIVQEVEEKSQQEEPTTVVVKKTVSQEAPGVKESVVKKEEKSETTTTKKVVVVQSQPEEVEEEEEEEEVVEEIADEEPTTVVIKKQEVQVQKQETKEVKEEIIEEKKAVEKIEVKQEEPEEEEEVEEEIEEQPEVKEEQQKKEPEPVKESEPEAEEVLEEEEEKYEEAEEDVQKPAPKEDKPAEKVSKAKDDEESEYTDEEVEEEVPVEAPKQTSAPAPVPAPAAAPLQDAPPKEPEAPKAETEKAEATPEGKKEESLEQTAQQTEKIAVQVEQPTKQPEKQTQPEPKVPLREPSIPLEKVEDVEIKPIGGASETYSKTHTEKTEIISTGGDRPAGTLSTQTEYNRIENIVTVNRTTKTLDHSYEQITQQVPSQQWSQPAPQPQPQHQPQPHFQAQYQPQPSYTESTLHDSSKITSNSYQQNNYPGYTPAPSNWASNNVGANNLSSVNSQSNQYSFINKTTSENYQNTSQQYSSSYVPPPWEQDPSYVAPQLELPSQTQNFYQPPPSSNTFNSSSKPGWKPTPPAGKFSKPAPKSYIPPAPNQSFVKPVSGTPEPINRPGSKTYYSEYERRYITVPESTYIPSDARFQAQPDPSPQYYYDNNEPTETVEHEWRKELREFTEKKQTQVQTQLPPQLQQPLQQPLQQQFQQALQPLYEQTSVNPPWEEDPKYSKVPTVTYNPTPSWSQTLRPQSMRERSFESEYVGSNEWSKTNTLGRSRPLSSYGNSNIEASSVERVRGVSVDRYNPNKYQSPLTIPYDSEHGPVQAHTLDPTPSPQRGYHNPNVPAYHARASAEPREQPSSIPTPRNWGDSRMTPLQSRSFKYLQWITGTED